MALINELALAGTGIALIPHILCSPEVEKGKLKGGLRMGARIGPIHAVYPSQRFLLPRLSAFIDHLVAS